MRICNYSETIVDYYFLPIFIVVVYLILILMKVSPILSAILLFVAILFAEGAINRCRNDMWCVNSGCL